VVRAFGQVEREAPTQGRSKSRDSRCMIIGRTSATSWLLRRYALVSCASSPALSWRDRELPNLATERHETEHISTGRFATGQTPQQYRM
jgi:hypothetical protein